MLYWERWTNYLLHVSRLAQNLLRTHCLRGWDKPNSVLFARSNKCWLLFLRSLSHFSPLLQFCLFKSTPTHTQCDSDIFSASKCTAVTHTAKYAELHPNHSVRLFLPPLVWTKLSGECLFESWDGCMTKQARETLRWSFWTMESIRVNGTMTEYQLLSVCCRVVVENK